MKQIFFCFIAAISFVQAAASAKKYYNILSLESSQYKGLITAEFIQFLELEAYKIGIAKQCLKEPRQSKKISMVELFDMFAGAETGAIIATTLALKNNVSNSKQPNQFFADSAIKFFDATINDIYYDIRMPTSLEVFIYLLFLGSFGSLAYYCTERAYFKKGYEDKLDFLGDYIRVRKLNVLDVH